MALIDLEEGEKDGSRERRLKRRKEDRLKNEEGREKDEQQGRKAREGRRGWRWRGGGMKG